MIARSDDAVVSKPRDDCDDSAAVVSLQNVVEVAYFVLDSSSV